jgi:hypothetical protein
LLAVPRDCEPSDAIEDCGEALFRLDDPDAVRADRWSPEAVEQPVEEWLAVLLDVVENGSQMASAAWAHRLAYGTETR